MITDPHSTVALTGASSNARALYVQALSLFQCYSGDPVAPLDEAIADSPAFVMAHVFKGYLHLIGTDVDAIEVAGGCYHDAARLPASAAELRHVAALEAMVAGRFAEAARRLEDVAIDNPHDALAIQVGHNLDFLTGRARMLRDRIARALPQWTEDMPGYHALLGMHAFGLEEMGDYARAEAAGKRAVELNPRDAWAQHAVAHVMEMQNRPEEGLKWMLKDPEAWSKDNFLSVHNWWHTALFHLELGEVDQVLSLYDGPIFGQASEVAFDILDASAMLWRLSLRGIDVGDRWDPVAKAWAPNAARNVYAFNDFHAALAFASIGDGEGLKAIGEAQSNALKSGGDNAMMVEQVGHPLVSAVKAFADGYYDAAVEHLRGVRNIAHRFGGSHAQRDLIDLTLIEAARRAGQTKLAEALVAERLDLKPNSRSAQALRASILEPVG